MSNNLETNNDSKGEVIKERLKELYGLDIFQELLYAGIGCLAFIFLYLLLPRTCWDEIYRNIICALITLGFFVIFILFNQPNTRKEFFKVDYRRNIVLLTVFIFKIF